MRVKKLIPISNIKMDRYPINSTTLDLVGFLLTGGEVPAIKVMNVGGTFEIRDGRHRVTAFKLLGRQLIMAHWGVDHHNQGAKYVKNNKEGSDLPTTTSSTSHSAPPLFKGEDGW